MSKITKNFLAAIIEATPNAVYIKDENGKYLMINEKGAAAVDHRVEDIIGKNDKDIFPNEVAKRVMALDKSVFAGNHHSGEEKVNDDLYFYSHKFILEDDDTAERVLIGISTDITGLKKTESELFSARRKADEANTHKSIFLQNMSHELRTPLNAIIGFSSILSGEGSVGIVHSDEKTQEYAKLINNSGIHLLSIINDLLDLSKIEAGELEFAESEIDISYEVQSCIRTLSTLAGENNITVSEEFPTQLMMLKGDEKTFRQLIYNLLSNAIKYSCPDGDVIVKGSIRNSGGIDVSIIDNGFGMSDEDLSTAMIPFRRAADVKNSDIAGTGLGLPLVDAFIKLFQGRLDMKSEKGVGTNATLHFPKERSQIT